MILLALLLAQAVVVPSPPPADVSVLPVLHPIGGWPAIDAATSLFVRDEVAAGRCAAAVRGPGGYRLEVVMAVLVGADGQAHGVSPVAIGCPTVEQYAVGIVSRMTRPGIEVADTGGQRWYRATLGFTWTG